MARTFAPEGVSAVCVRGHAWDEENTYHHPGGHRICRACRRLRVRIPPPPKPKARRTVEQKVFGPMLPVEWMDRAACKYVDPELFFPVSEGPADAVAAVKVCRGCPVRSECLDVALSLSEATDGVWGGTTARERKALRKKLRARVGAS